MAIAALRVYPYIPDSYKSSFRFGYYAMGRVHGRGLEADASASDAPINTLSLLRSVSKNIQNPYVVSTYGLFHFIVGLETLRVRGKRSYESVLRYMYYDDRGNTYFVTPHVLSLPNTKAYTISSNGVKFKDHEIVCALSPEDTIALQDKTYQTGCLNFSPELWPKDNLYAFDDGDKTEDDIKDFADKHGLTNFTVHKKIHNPGIFIPLDARRKSHAELFFASGSTENEYGRIMSYIDPKNEARVSPPTLLQFMSGVFNLPYSWSIEIDSPDKDVRISFSCDFSETAYVNASKHKPAKATITKRQYHRTVPNSLYRLRESSVTVDFSDEEKARATARNFKNFTAVVAKDNHVLSVLAARSLMIPYSVREISLDRALCHIERSINGNHVTERTTCHEEIDYCLLDELNNKRDWQRQLLRHAELDKGLVICVESPRVLEVV